MPMYFNAKWITYATGDYKTAEDRYGNPSPYFRKTFSLGGAVKKAELLISAIGVYKAYLNGKPVSGDYLSPGWVDYNKKVPFLRYDITDQLSADNAIGIVLGDGWAVGRLGTSQKRNSYNDRLELSAQIRIEYTDGSADIIETDESWSATAGEIRRNDIYMGEYVDKRMAVGDFSVFSYDASAWGRAEDVTRKASRSIYLEEATVPPIVVKHTFKPVLLSREGNTYLYDISQNISGVLNCVFRGEAGAQFVIRHGEMLSGGRLYTENLRKAEAIDTCILAGTGDEHFRPLFTFHGFRYAEITVTGNAEILDITAEAMYSDLTATGSFSCSDPTVNKVYQNALWSQRDNFLNVPTDCPQRDERLGWTADAQIFCLSAMYNMDCNAFFKKYMADIRDAQLGNGIVPVAAPIFPIGYRSFIGYSPAAGWSEAIGEIPYHHYQMYGDKQVVRDNLPGVKRLLDYYEATCPDHIRRPLTFTYGDWLSLDESDIEVISTLYYARLADLAAKLCRVIGDYEQTRYGQLYLDIKAAFLKTFLDSEGKILSDTQSVYVMAYQFGLIGKEAALKNLNRKFIEDDGKLTCGFLGIRFLLPTLCDIGRTDLAYRLITNTEYPGWGYSVVNGATTIWERWDSYTIENGINSQTMNSFNHYSFGSCTEWMYGYCLGIRPDQEMPGFQKVVFAPHFDFSGKINWAKGYYDTAFGRIRARWKRDGDQVEYTVSFPQGIASEFRFDGLETVSQAEENGTYRFLLRQRT